MSDDTGGLLTDKSSSSISRGPGRSPVPTGPISTPGAAGTSGAPSFGMLPLRYDQPTGRYDIGWRYDSAAAPERQTRIIKPKLELTRQSDNELVELATVIKNAMTTNAAKFPNSAATVTALGTAITAYGVSLQAAADARLSLQALVDAKDGDRVMVETQLRSLSGQVNEVAQGDINLIHDAGMQGSNDPTPVTMTQVQNLRLAPSDHEGELLAQWEPVRGARFYKVQVSLDTSSPPTNWQFKLDTTKTKARLNDTLVSGQKVWVRTRAEGAQDVGAWSDPVVKTVP